METATGRGQLLNPVSETHGFERFSPDPAGFVCSISGYVYVFRTLDREDESGHTGGELNFRSVAPVEFKDPRLVKRRIRQDTQAAKFYE